MISREKLRGKKLDKDCKTAHTEHSLDDDRVFCLGLIDLSNDELLEKCEICKAYVDNSEPYYQTKGERMDKQ